MSPPGQRLGQVPGRLGRPFQRRHRIAPGLRLHQRLQCLKQTRIGLDQRPASRPRPADPAVLRLGRLDFPPATGHRVRVRPGRLGDPLGPASAQGHSLGPQHQPPRLLIQVRPHQLVPARYILISHTSHIAQTKPPPHHETQLIDQRALSLAEHFQTHPDADIYLSQPGLGVVLGARVLGEFGDYPNRYTDAKSRRNYAGTSPPDRERPARNRLLARHVRNRRLYDAIDQWAFCAISSSPGARAFYDQHRAADDTHHQALRALGNRLVGILHGCPATTPDTTNTPPGHTAPRSPLDTLRPWDVYTAAAPM